MKKVMVMLRVCGVFLLCSCNSSKNKTNNRDHFKEYNLANKVTVLEASAIKQSVIENAKSIVSLTGEIEYYAFSAGNEGEAKTNQVVTYFDEPSDERLYIATYKYSENSSATSNGIKVSDSYKAEGISWDTGSGYIAMSDKETKNGIIGESVEATPLTKTSIEHKNDELSSFPEQVHGDCYQNKDKSYIFITSEIEKETQTCNVGNTTKEWVRTRKYQVVFNVSKDYKLLDGYSCETSIANRDEVNGDWFDKEKIVYSSYRRYTLSYGTRSKKSIPSINSSLGGKRPITNFTIEAQESHAYKDGDVYKIDNPVETIKNIDLINKDDNNPKRQIFTVTTNAGQGVKFQYNVSYLNDNGIEENKSYPIDLTQLKNKVTLGKDDRNEDFFINTEDSEKTYIFTVYFDGLKVVAEDVKLSR